MSQDDLPQTHTYTQRQITREVGVSQRTVNRILKKDLRLRSMKNVGHMNWLMEDLLPEIQEFSEFYIFQQDGAAERTELEKRLHFWRMKLLTS